MNGFLLANAFAAGMLAALNPCAFAMLPSFVAFYLGAKKPDYVQPPLGKLLAQVLGITILVTSGFLTIFIVGGFLISVGLSSLFDWMPYLMLPVALTLILLGVALLLGRSVPLSIPTPTWAVRRRGLAPMYLYGAGYALASSACTLPIFVVVVGSAAAAGGAITTLVMFASFGLGMSTILLAVTVSAALFRGVVARWLRGFIRYVRPVSAVLLIAAGIYLIGYMLYFLFGIGRAMPMPRGNG